MSIENLTLAHFRHFRHFSSLLTNEVRKITYEIINLFLQNEPNFRKSQVSLSVLLIGDYVQLDTWSIRKKQSQTKPNKPKTNPILANKTPIRTQFKPNLSCCSPLAKQEQTQFHIVLAYLSSRGKNCCRVTRILIIMTTTLLLLYSAGWPCLSRYGQNIMRKQPDNKVTLDVQYRYDC